MSAYKLSLDGWIIRSADSASIPQDPLNSDYLVYLAWVEEGNTPDPADPVPEVFAALDARQIRQALSKLSLRAKVEAYIAAGSQDLKDWWQWSPTFLRDDDVVASVAAGLNVPSATVDELWRTGAAL